jgi:hypothetical protein
MNHWDVVKLEQCDQNNDNVYLRLWYHNECDLLYLFTFTLFASSIICSSDALINVYNLKIQLCALYLSKWQKYRLKFYLSARKSQQSIHIIINLKAWKIEGLITILNAI